jgi:hypothetical protein
VVAIIRAFDLCIRDIEVLRSWIARKVLRLKGVLNIFCGFCLYFSFKYFLSLLPLFLIQTVDILLLEQQSLKEIQDLNLEIVIATENLNIISCKM